MNPNGRMKEITNNLRKDTKDLLVESANLVTSLFKQGLCTFRGISNRWKSFAREIAGAIGNLQKPPFEDGPEVPDAVHNPDGEPIVTIVESPDERLPKGRQLPLSEANRLIKQICDEHWDSPDEPKSCTVVIDYMLNGETDRYWLPFKCGPGYDLLGHMENHVLGVLTNPSEAHRFFYDAKPEFREKLHAAFGPQLHNDLTTLSTKVLRHFQNHCAFSELKRQYDSEANILPENARGAFLQEAHAHITALKRMINTGSMFIPAAQQQPETQESAPDQPRKSVKVRIQEQSQAGPRNTQQKKRTGPQR